MRTIPQRPDQLASELWYYDDEELSTSTSYLDILGCSPEITNHISTVTFTIISGAGAIATEGMVAKVEAEDEVTVLPGTQYWYSGQMNMLVTYEPALIPKFVTFGREKLGRPERRLLRKIGRITLRQQVLDDMWVKFGPSIEAYTDLLVDMERQEDKRQTLTTRR